MKILNSKIIFLLIAFANLSAIRTHAQSWSPLGTGMGPVGSSGTVVSALIADGNNIYAGGYFDTAGGVPVNNVAQWNGTTWDSMGGGFFDGTVAAFAEYKGNIYAGGYFSYSDSTVVNNIAMWDGNTWKPLGAGLNGNVGSLVVYDSMLYVLGFFDSAGNIPANGMAAWNGSAWSAPSGASNLNSYGYVSINATLIYGGNLIVGGNFDSIGGVPAKNIAMWNGSNWSQFGNGLNEGVYGLASDGNNLYAGGGFDSSGSTYISPLALWNGADWSAIGSAGPAKPISAYTLTVSNGILYASGELDTTVGASLTGIAQWDGTSWTKLTAGNGLRLDNGSGGDGYVTSLLVNNGNLYAGGTYITIGGDSLNNIAVLSTAAGINSIAGNGKATVYPNPGFGLLNITLENINEPCHVDVYDMLGQKIYHAYLSGGINTIDIGKQPGGTYLYRITDKNETPISTGKYILE